MQQRAVVRAMRAEDIGAVLEIQSCCYDAEKLESAQSFLAKLTASPESCFIAVLAEAPVGYLVAMPSEAGSPPPLNAPTFSVPHSANALYLHDLATHPRARGFGAAAALVAAYFQVLRQSGARFGCLTAVNASGAYWERYGFRPAALADAERMATYGDGAQYMTMTVND